LECAIGSAGVRYNAEKKQAGKYFSTKIWSFRMKCHLCDNWMEIHTDPQVSWISIATLSLAAYGWMDRWIDDMISRG